MRVGGGWQTLQNYLKKHDPCRNNLCKRKIFLYLNLHIKCNLLDMEKLKIKDELQSLNSLSKEVQETGL